MFVLCFFLCLTHPLICCAAQRRATMQGGRLVLAAGAAFVLFALLSYVFVRPGKHDR